MKKFVLIIGIACAFCCNMLIKELTAPKVPNFAEEVRYHSESYEDIIWADIESCYYWDYDYADYSIIEYPSEENDGKLKYVTYDSNGEILTMNSIDYDWACYKYNK